jgi:FkbM family methyltransferase
MWHGGWQRRELEQAVKALVASGRLAPQSVFVDVGANIGTHTVYAMRTGCFARAVAFEPEPRNVRLLEMNLAANGLAEVTKVIAKAAGEAAGTAALHIHPRNRGAHAIGEQPSDDGTEQIDVPIVRVDDALAEVGVTVEEVGLVWVDVEGYEPQVLRGLSKLMEARIPIAFEYSPKRYTAGEWSNVANMLAKTYTAFHLLSGAEHRSDIAALASLDRDDDVLVY